MRPEKDWQFFGAGSSEMTSIVIAQTMQAILENKNTTWKF
jgi:hypothetical protein